MEIRLEHVTVGELVAGYSDNGDDGVVGYDGELDIRRGQARSYLDASI